MIQLITTISYWVLASFWLLVFVLYMANYSHIRNARATIGIMLLVTAFIGGVEFTSSTFFKDFVQSFHISKTQALMSNGENWKDLLTTQNIRLFSGILLLVIFIFWLIPMEVKEKGLLQRKIEESEERFRTITENTTDITIIYKPDYGFNYISTSVEGVIGYKANELYGTDFRSFIHPDDFSTFMEFVEKAKATENVTQNMRDFRVLHKNGSWIYFEGRITHMPNVRGVEGLVINCRDVQKRKEAYDLLNHRLSMDTMVSKISTEFINSESNDIHSKIEKTLFTLGDFSKVDHVYLYQLNEEKQVFENMFTWNAPEKPSVVSYIDPVTYDAYPWILENLEGMESVYIPDVLKLPKKASKEKEAFSNAGLRSVLLVPVSREGRLYGFLMLDTLKNVRTWEKHDISLLNVIAEIISNALQRYITEENLVTLSRAVEQSMSSVVILTPEGVVRYVNKKFEDTTGYSSFDIVGKNIVKSSKNFGFGDRFSEVMNTVKKGDEWRGEVLSRKKNGDELWEEVGVSPIKNSKGEIKHILSVREDLTQKKEYENKLIYQANYDDLTSLPNRALAHDRLSEAIVRAQLHKESVAAIILGLDTFKKVNETLGHHVGDELLVQASLRLKHYVNDFGTLARLGGDEFLMVLPIDHDDYAEIIASRVLDAFSKPFYLGENEVTVTASLGISIAPSDGVDPQLILRNAGSAMHRAKDEGRNNFQFYAEEMHSEALKRIQMEGYLRRAQELNELELYYQPIVESKTQRVIGAEALLRWNNPHLGPVSPADFIPLAEDLGIIVPMGEWILKTACMQAASWSQSENAPDYVSVNVSVRQFKGEDFPNVVRKTLAETKLDPRRLKVEVTESLLVNEDLNSTVDKALTELKAIGVRISLDDFGTGYSSLSYLKRYDFDTLKIDRSFVRDVPEDKEDKALVEAIMAMAHSLEMEVVAEGVENLEQLTYLRDVGCDSIQGFYYSKPLPSQQFDSLLQNWKHVS